VKRLAAALCACLALAGCGRPGPASVARTGTTTAVVPPPPTVTTTTVAAAPQVALAAALVRAETGIRDPATPPADVPALGRVQQEAYRALVLHPEWDGEVLALVPERLRATVEANAGAGRDLKALNQPDPTRPRPRWHIVAPEPAAGLMALYKAAGAAAGGVPWPYLAAIHVVETGTGRIRGDSTAGAQGPMQFIPSTWALYGRGGDITSTTDAVYAAARLLRASGAPSDMARALRAYNDSARYVRAVTAYAEQITADERAFLGYHAWEIYYQDRLLPAGTTLE
jgi:hypothetical protein